MTGNDLYIAKKLDMKPLGRKIALVGRLVENFWPAKSPADALKIAFSFFLVGFKFWPLQKRLSTAMLNVKVASCS